MRITTDDFGISIKYSELSGAASTSLAQIEYWDADGKEKKTAVSKNFGWQIKFDNNKWEVQNAELGLSFKAKTLINETEIVFLVSRESIIESKSCLFKNIIPLPSLIKGKENDGSSLVIPYEEGGLCHCRDKTQGEYVIPMYAHFPSYANMSILGINYGKNNALAAVIADGRLDSSLLVKTCWGDESAYIVDSVFAIREYADEQIMPEDIKIHYFILQGEKLSFVDFGKCYREFNRKERKLPTLTEKMKNNPALEYSSKAISLRCRLGVKPVPVQILEQTPENQPPVNVTMSFDNVGMLVKECATQQLGPIEFNLVGWNYGGHDGAFPQLFPVEEALGGESKLHDLIELTHENNYPISLHDCYFDAYSLADTFDMEKINRNHDGSPTLGGQYAGGQAYQVCPGNAYEYALDNIPEVANLKVKGAYYTDVLSVAQLTKCYHPDHPMSRRDNAYWWKKILGKIQKQFGVSYSEGARDWALPELDRAYLISLSSETSLPFIDEKVPIFQIAYHGFLIYNSFRGGVNSFPGDVLYLKNIAYGGMPIVYYHHIHNPTWGAGDGWDKDLTFEGMEKLKVDVAKIKHITADVAKYSSLQTEFIDNFIQHSPTLSETVYSNGSRIWVNYANDPCKVASGEIVPAKNFIVITKN